MDEPRTPPFWAMGTFTSMPSIAEMAAAALDAVFHPSQLSAISGQVKFTTEGKKAEFAIHPIGIPRDPEKPLAYLTLLMELGNDSKYQENHFKIILKN
jgi:hypothetical protein